MELKTILTDTEIKLLNRLIIKLVKFHRPKNLLKEEYYEGHNHLKDLGISLPEELRSLHITPAWANISVEALNDRINLEGFVGSTPEVEQIFTTNNLDLESNLAHRDALIYGTCYLLAQPGDETIGQPAVVITAESPIFCISEEDQRTGFASAFLKVYETSNFCFLTFVLPDRTIYLKLKAKLLKSKDLIKPSKSAELTAQVFGFGWNELSSDNGIVDLYDFDLFAETDYHDRGYVPVVKLVNRGRAGAPGGKSEISRNLRQFIDDAQRTLASAVSVREIYSVPRVHLLGVDGKQFVDKDGNPIAVVDSSYSNNYTVIGAGPNGEVPQLEQLQPGTVDSYIALLKQYAGEVSTMTGLPITMLGYQNSNPTSAESIEASLNMLSKRAEDRTKSFGKAWMQIMVFACKIAGIEVPQGLRPKWRNTRITSSGSIAQADAVSKIIASGYFQPGYDDDLIGEMLGLDDARIAQLKENHKASNILNVNTQAQALRTSGFSVPGVE